MHEHNNYSREEREMIANTIIQQLGGFRALKIMIAAKGFQVGETEQGAFLLFKFKGYKKANVFKITLTKRDDYIVELIKLGTMRTCYRLDVVKRQEGLYFDDLIPFFERNTNLSLIVPEVIGL